ncbi:MAG: sigma-70 family RNA polymerase sigma factor [Anaerolineae bacterium]
MDWTEQVVAAQQGDLAAFEAVVRRFQDMAIAYAYSILGDFHLAEDAAQEAFLGVYNDLPMLRQPRAFPSWLRRIVAKHCDRLSRRKQLPLVALDATAEVADPTQEPFEAARLRLTHDTVLATITSLPEAERTATALYFINGYSMAEVGEFLDVPLSTVKNRLHSARRQLRERMVGLVEETLKQHAPGDDFSRKVRNVLEGIERINWETTSVLCFTGSVVGAMHFLGEPVSNDYVMGISGGAFKMLWIPPWSPANCDLLIVGEEPIARTFATLGYDYTFVHDFDREHRALTKAEYTQRIKESVDAGMPVLAIGVVGPPEVCVIAGYDRDGEVLFGRSYFQEQSQEENDYFAGEEWYGTLKPELVKGYFRSDEWYDHIYGLILIGAKRDKPSPEQALKASLQWAVDLARVPMRPMLWPSEGQRACYSGFAAFDQMIAGALRDEDFPPDAEAITYRLYALGNDGSWLMMGKRAAAAAYLEEMLPHAGPAAEPLRRAITLYRQEVPLWEKAGRLATWSGAPDAEKLKLVDRGRREQFAEQVRQAKALEEQAVAQLEQALAAL